MAITVRISETYDLKTSVNKIGIIGVHTPTSAQLNTMYPGLVKNHKFMKLVKCDIAGACASVLPADPLQVGVSSGEVSPEDMFNPILYRAVSNASFDSLVGRIYRAIDAQRIKSINVAEDWSNADTSFDIYYSLLAENKRWKRAMPQSGFALRNLVPLCYQMVNSYGNITNVNYTQDLIDDDEATMTANDLTNVNSSKNGIGETIVNALATTFRGKPVRMPSLPMHIGIESVDEPSPNFAIPKTFCAVFIIPPARLHEFYYRMRITWTVKFYGLMTAQEISTAGEMITLGQLSRGTNYSYGGAKSLENTSDTVDADNVSIKKVMES